MTGQMGLYGTGAFNLVLDMNEMGKLNDAVAKPETDIEKMFGMSTKDDGCAIGIKNNIANIKQNDVAVCVDDGYDMGF